MGLNSFTVRLKNAYRRRARAGMDRHGCVGNWNVSVDLELLSVVVDRWVVLFLQCTVSC
jgi:hypothetical protein